MMNKLNEQVRLDKWLWAARFFKTRSLASQAIHGGKVHVNGHRAKACKIVNIHDTLKITSDFGEQTVTVLALSAQRGPASVAATLYKETDESIAQRLQRKEMHRLGAQITHEQASRPTKKDRRELEKLRTLF